MRELLRDILAAIPDAPTRARVEALANELEQGEQQLRLALQASQLGIWDWVPGEPARWDDRCRQIFGLGAGSEPLASVGEFFLQSVHPEDQERRRLSIARALDPASGGIYHCQFRVLIKDAGERWVESQGQVLFDGEGKPRRFIGTALDITARKREEEEAAVRAGFNRQLVSIISHDLRNPLQTITISAASLERSASSALDDKQVAALDRIVAAAERAGSMVRDLLDFTSAHLGGGLQIERKPAELDFIVASAVERLRLRQPTRAVRLEGAAGLVQVDAERIAQVVDNLLSNADRNARPDTVISLALAGDPESVSLRVHNDGEPIPAEVRKQLFQPHQGSKDRSLGLGLYLSREIVRAHGGTIAVSEPGEKPGTTFTVRLPRT